MGVLCGQVRCGLWGWADVKGRGVGAGGWGNCVKGMLSTVVEEVVGWPFGGVGTT